MKTSKKLIGLTLIAFVCVSKQAQFNADSTIASYQSAFDVISNSLNNSLDSLKNGVNTNLSVTVVKPTVARSTAVSSSSANAIASDNSVATAQSTQNTGANALATKNSSANSGAVSNSTANAIAAKDSVANAVSSGNNNANAVATNQSIANTNSNTNTNSLSQAVNNSQANSLAASNTNSNAIAQNNSVAVSNASSKTDSLSQAANNSKSNSAAISNNNSQANALNGSVAVADSNSNTGSNATALNGSIADSLAKSNTGSIATALNGSVSISNANTNTGSNAVAVNGSQSFSVNNNQALSNSAAVNGGFSSNTANSTSHIDSISVNGTIFQPNNNNVNHSNNTVTNSHANDTSPQTTLNNTSNNTRPNNSNSTYDCDNKTVAINHPSNTTNLTNITTHVPAPTNNNNTECLQPISSIPLCKGICPKDDDKFFYAQYNETHEILISLKVHKANEKYLKSKSCIDKNNTHIENSSASVQEGSEEFYNHCRGVCMEKNIDFCETTRDFKPERLFRCKCSGINSSWHFKIGGGFDKCPYKDLSNCKNYMTNQLILNGGVNKNDVLDMFNNVKADNNNCNNKKLRGSKNCLIPDNQLENAEREQFYSKDKLMEFRGNFKVAGNAVNHVHRLMDDHREDKHSLVPEFKYQQAVKLHERPHVNITNLNHIHKCNENDLKHIHMGLPDYAKEIKFEFGNNTKSNNKMYKCDEDEKGDIVDELKHVGV